MGRPRKIYVNEKGDSISRQRAWQLKQAALGRCVRCGNEAVTKAHCQKHRLLELKKSLEMARKKKGCKPYGSKLLGEKKRSRTED